MLWKSDTVPTELTELIGVLYMGRVRWLGGMMDSLKSLLIMAAVSGSLYLTQYWT